MAFCIYLFSLCIGTSLVAQTVKCLSTMQETWVRSLGWEDPLEKEMAIHSRTIAWKIPWIEEPGRLQSIGSQRVGHDWANSLITFAQFTHVIACISTSVLFNGETLFLWHSIFPFFIHQLIDIWVVSTL